MAVPIALIAQLAMAGYKAASGAKQKSDARKIERNNKRPNYKAKQAEEAAALARYAQQNPELFGQSIAENRIGGGIASGVRNVRESGGGVNDQLAAIVALSQAGNKSRENMAMGLEDAQAGRRGALNQALMQQQRANDYAFQTNKLDPYMAAMQSASDLRTAGNHNMYNAVSDVASGLGAYAKMMAAMSPEQKAALAAEKANRKMSRQADRAANKASRLLKKNAKSEPGLDASLSNPMAFNEPKLYNSNILTKPGKVAGGVNDANIMRSLGQLSNFYG